LTDWFGYQANVTQRLVHVRLIAALRLRQSMKPIEIDIVSDVVCPWCIVGYQQLTRAISETRISAQIHWQPFELNPAMPAEGQNLTEHMTQKYGTTRAQSDENRQRLTELGASLGFTFAFTEHSRIVNTFRAHQLLHWAGLQSVSKEHDLKLALFHAYFTDHQDISDDNVLLAAAISVGFDTEETLEVLQHEPFAEHVRRRQKLWTDRGISGVPAMVFCNRYVVTGAQGVENYVSVINQVIAEETMLPILKKSTLKQNFRASVLHSFITAP